MSRKPKHCTGATSEEVEENSNETSPASKKQKRDHKHKDRVDAPREEDIDAPREEEESAPTNSSSLSSTTSISSFFQQIPLTNRRPTVEEAFGISPQFTCIGRTDQLLTILRSIIIPWSPISKPPAFYIHASPGVGKTFLLKQLFTNNFPQEYEGWKDNFFFLVADFNRDACIQAETFKKHFLSEPELFILLRIFYVQFVDQERWCWKYFLKIFFKRVPSDELKEDAKNYIIKQLRKSIKESGCTKVVLLVDEILKTKDLGDDFSRSCRSALCSYLDGPNPLYHDIIFSSLSAEFMVEECTSFSRRAMNPICSLPLLTFEDTCALLKTYIECEFSKQEGNPTNDIRSYCLRQLAVICGGHGRSIESVVRVSNNQNAKTLSLTDIIREAANRISANPNINVNLILQAILLGESVGMGDMIGGETCGSLVSRGIFVHSFTYGQQTFIPRCPELFLHAWVKMPELDRNLEKYLFIILAFCDNFNRKSFETLHSLWEQLIRCVRTDIKYKTMPLREVYRIDHRDLKVKHNPNCTENATNCPVDAQFELTVIEYKSRTTVEVALNTILIPKSENNAGWDRLIFYEAFPARSATTNTTKKPYVLPVFIQNKWSVEDATTMLNRDTVKAAVGHCRNFLKSCRFTNCQLIPRESIKFPFGFSNSQFIVIILARQNSNQNTLTLAPTNVMFCFEEELNLLYGPTLASFVKYLTLDHHYATQPTQNLTVASSSSSSSSTITPSTTITPSSTTATASDPPTTEEKEKEELEQFVWGEEKADMKHQFEG